MKKKFIALFFSVLCVFIFDGCSCKHEWADATCIAPRTCALCSQTEGSTGSHQWQDATCSKPKTCSVCGVEDGYPLGHNFTEATCLSPASCTTCGYTKNTVSALHQWVEATDTSPKTCSLCDITEGLSLTEQRKQDFTRILSSANQLATDGHFLLSIQTLESAFKQTGNSELLDALADLRFQFGCYNSSAMAAGKHNSAVLNKDGTVTVVGRNNHGELAANSWTNITAVSLGNDHIVGLKNDGTVVAAGSNASARCNVVKWQNIVAISAGDSHTVALAEDGCVLATGYDEYGQCQVEDLMNAAGGKRIVSIAAGYFHTVALLEDGTAVSCGDSRFKADYVQNWTDLAAIYAGSMYTAGLKTDGTVVVTGQYVDNWNVGDWTDIINLSAGDNYLIGLKSDGTVVSAGLDDDNLQETHRSMHYWQNITHISTGYDHTIAMDTNGNILCAGVNNFGQCDLANTSATLESAAPADSNSTNTADSGEEVSYILFDHFVEPVNERFIEYADVIGMNANGAPVWIYPTQQYFDHWDSYIEEIGQIGQLYFILEEHTITALNCATGQAVWQHTGVDYVEHTITDDGLRISCDSHDILVTADGTISCTDEGCTLKSSLKPVSPAKTASSVRFDYFYYGNYEGFGDDGFGDRANIIGLDKMNNPVWIYRSTHSEYGLCSPISELGTYGNTYYFLDNGTPTALDIKTGKILWQNNEISLAGASSFIDSNGTIYACGFLINDFVAISSQGKTLAHIEVFDEDYFWPCAIEKKSGKLYVIFSGTYSENKYRYNAFAVNPRDYTYEFVPDYPYDE